MNIEIRYVDLLVGIGWIIISILQTFTLGFESIIVWLATIVIWSYIIRTREGQKLK